MIRKRELRRNKSRRKCRKVLDDLISHNSLLEHHMNKIHRLIYTNIDGILLEKAIYGFVQYILKTVLEYKMIEIDKLKNDFQRLKQQYEDLKFRSFLMV